uniref:Uncharacterized protein n=1 Tax=Arundo donax TaxID=35708 RepID=A0A0A8YGI4_ARUDO
MESTSVTTALWCLLFSSLKPSSMTPAHLSSTLRSCASSVTSATWWHSLC